MTSPRGRFNSGISSVAMAFENLDQFNRELETWARVRVPEEILLFQKWLALTALRMLVLMTPVDTGRARGGWQVDINKSREGQAVGVALRQSDESAEQFDQPPPLSEVGQSTFDQGAAVITGMAVPFQTVIIFNNVKYILVLDGQEAPHGRPPPGSPQAPEGMTRIVLRDLENIVRQANEPPAALPIGA